MVISAKSTSDAYNSTLPFPPDPNSSQSTISTVEREIKEAGGDAIAIPADVRNHGDIQHLVQKTVNVRPQMNFYLLGAPACMVVVFLGGFFFKRLTAFPRNTAI